MGLLPQAGLTVGAFSQAFTFDAQHISLLWGKLGVHVELCVEAMLISLVVAVPLGVLLGHLHRFSFLAINISNLGRAVPSLSLLAILLALIGIGHTEVIIALVVLAVPPILTNTYVAVDQVDGDAVEAAKGMGLRPWQVITKIELPLGLPLIFAGIRTSAVFVVATATLAGTFGGGGLGDIITDEASYHLAGVIGASYILIVLAFVAQGLFLLVERAVTPHGLRTPRMGTSATLSAEPAGERVSQAA